MVTYLYALRWSADVEARLAALQSLRFRLTGDVNVRALPPLIPVLQTPCELSSGDLDRLRWDHAVSFSGWEAPRSRATVSQSGREAMDEPAPHGMSVAPDDRPPPCLIDLSMDEDFLRGWRALQTALRHRVAARNPDADPREHSVETPEHPSVALSWWSWNRSCSGVANTAALTGASPVSLPRTAAFWLSLVRVETETTDAGQALLWDLLFSRRVSRGPQ